MQGEARVDGDRVRLRVEASGEDGKPLNGLSTPMVFFAPDGKQTTARLEQSGPGVYEGEVGAGGAGTYVAIVKPSDGVKALSPVIIGVTVRANSELLTLKSDHDATVRLAQATGGRVWSLREPTAQALFDRSTIKPREVATNIWRSLLVATMGVLLLDIATRRVAWDRWISRQYGAEMARDAAELVRDRGTQAAVTLGGLRARQGDGAANADSPASLTLTDDDAKRLAEAARDRRRAQRLGGTSISPTPTSETLSAVSVREAQQDPAASEEGGLLAAKRRAQKRMEERSE